MKASELMKELFALPDFVMPLFVLCLGYPREPMPAVKPRLPLAAVLHQDRYDDETWRGEVEGYNAQVKAYFAQISEKEGRYDWVDRCNNAIKRKPRYEVTDFVHGSGMLQK